MVTSFCLTNQNQYFCNKLIIISYLQINIPLLFDCHNVTFFFYLEFIFDCKHASFVRINSESLLIDIYLICATLLVIIHQRQYYLYLLYICFYLIAVFMLFIFDKYATESNSPSKLIIIRGNYYIISRITNKNDHV